MSVKLVDIARLIGANIPHDAEDIEVRGITSIENAGPHDVSFLSNPRYAHYLKTTRAAAVIVPEDAVLPQASVPLAVKDPYIAFVKVLELFNDRTPADIASGIDPDSRIHPEAVLVEDVSVGPYAVINQGVTVGGGTVIGSCSVILKDCKIGKNCIIYPNVTIMDGCEIGNRVILHAGVVIGSDGFGFAPHEGRYFKILQIGRVRISDDVEIQAGTCIDRAVFGETVIEKGTKLDNLIQVGHNVHTGSDTVIASMVGISGSTEIGNGVRIGGQAGFAGHLKVGDKVNIGGRAGVTKDVADGETVSGFPARKHAQELRLEASLGKLPEMLSKIKAQEKKIKELEQILNRIKKNK